MTLTFGESLTVQQVSLQLLSSFLPTLFGAKEFNNFTSCGNYKLIVEAIKIYWENHKDESTFNAK